MGGNEEADEGREAAAEVATPASAPADDPNAWAYAPQPKLPPREVEAGTPFAAGAPSGPGAGGQEVPPELLAPGPGIAKGQEWGTPLTVPVDEEVLGTDAMLAAQYVARPDAIIGFLPTGNSDLARTLGLPTDVYARTPTHLRPLDVIDAGRDGVAVNAVVFGIAPDLLGWGSTAATIVVEVDGDEVFRGRSTTVIVASGQFVNGNDLVPRGHPGDGRLEVQAYHFSRSERKKLREKIRNGSHLPHRKIRERSGRTVRITSSKPLPLALDGRSGGTVTSVEITVRPGALQLAV